MGLADGIEPLLLGVAARCLRMTPEAIDPRVPLTRYGLDSLNAVELAVAVSAASGMEIAEDALLDAPSIRELAASLMRRAASSSQYDLRLGRIRADAHLPADIDPLQARPPADGAILLTGATGFLGVHLLKALLAASHCRIVCPVRASDDAQAMARLRAAMHRYGVAITAAEPRVVAIAAYVAESRFGLSEQRYRRLGDEVTVIYHCAAEVNWTLGYESLRVANVIATRELLRFACTGVRKHFHFVSSVAACYSTCGSVPIDESGGVAGLSGIHLGYGQSKWAAERLVEAARARGLSATLYRPSLICGDSTSGRGNDDDLIAQLIRGVIELGHAPDLDWRLDACPVDFVARAIAEAAHPKHERLSAVHLRNPWPARWSEIVLWINLRGYRVQMEPMPAWLARAEQASRDPAHGLHRLRGFLFARPANEGGRTLAEIYADPRVATIDATRSDRWMVRSGLACPRIGSRLLDRFFATWMDRGLLPQPTSGVTRGASSPSRDLDEAIQALLRHHYATPELTVTRSRQREFGFEHSLLGELTAWCSGAEHGMQVRSLELEGCDTLPVYLDLVVKPKFSDRAVLEVGTQVAALCAPSLGTLFAAHAPATGLLEGKRRELAIYSNAVGALRDATPRYFGMVEAENACMLLLERVHDIDKRDGIDHPEIWTDGRIETTLRGIGRIHGEWLERGAELDAVFDGALAGEFDAARAAGSLWEALAAHAQPALQQWLGEDGARAHRQLARTCPAWLGSMQRHPRTLIHNDFNPRNFVLHARAGEPRLCAFDWELAVYGLPQRDLVELLCFVLPHDVEAARVEYFSEVHRALVDRTACRPIGAVDWRTGLGLALADFGVRRLPMYFLAQRFRPQSYLNRVARTWWRLVQDFGATELCPH